MNHTDASIGFGICDFSEVCSIVDSGVRKFDGYKRYVRTGHVIDNEIIDSELVTYDNRPSRANMEVREGDVLCAKMQATEKVLLITETARDFLFSTGFAILRPMINMILPKFLQYYLRSKHFQVRKDELASGATQKAINNSSLETLTVPVPLLSSQEKITAILERADLLGKNREQANQIASRIPQVIFLKMFGDPVINPKGWKTTTVESVCTEIIDCPHSTPTYSDHGVPLVRTPNIKKGFLDFKETKFVSAEEHQKRSLRIRPIEGDILYAREATYGNAGLVGSENEFSVGQRIVLLRGNPRIIEKN